MTILTKIKNIFSNKRVFKIVFDNNSYYLPNNLNNCIEQYIKCTKMIDHARIMFMDNLITNEELYEIYHNSWQARIELSEYTLMRRDNNPFDDDENKYYSISIFKDDQLYFIIK
jgi:hypothetical protein